MKTKLSMGILVIFSVMLVGGSVFAADEITAYMGMSPDNNITVVKYIKKKTGIHINQTFQSFGEIEAKVKAEAPNFNADMCLGVGSPLTFMAKKNKWSAPYKSPNWKGVDKVFVDPEGYWFNISNFSFVLVGNKDALAKKGYALPGSWQELLDPKWKGEIVMASPLSSGTANMIRFSFLALYGDKGGWDFMEKLDKNIHHYTRSGNAPTDLVGRGEFLLGITSDENVKNRIDQGYPLIWGVPKEGIGYDGTFAFIFSTTKGNKLSLCQKVIDALGDQELSDIMAEIGYMTPRPASNKLYGAKTPKYIDLDLGKAAEERPKNNDIWKSKFRTTFK
ncbi:MAG: extracellular solute-binding protein [Deltaproteobacteria bacterium]|nr:extracellular solute-binding protein [Deltaproteobacteria bacterium]